MINTNHLQIRSTILIFLFLISISINAQKNVVHGKITLFSVIAIEKAEITVKKTKKSVLSDSFGFFDIECSIKDKLSISAAGFDKKFVKIKNLKDSIYVDLEIAGTESDIELAAANGHIKRSDVNFVTKRFNTKPLYSLGYPNMLALITGKFPEVSLINGELVLRGSNSISENSKNGALIVLNGILSDVSVLNSIVVTEVKNITILSGSQASRYGPGSGNGVIAIELNSY